MLHLHPAALPRQVRLVGALREHAVLAETALVLEPALRDAGVVGPGRRARPGPAVSREGRPALPTSRVTPRASPSRARRSASGSPVRSSRRRGAGRTRRASRGSPASLRTATRQDAAAAAARRSPSSRRRRARSHRRPRTGRRPPPRRLRRPRGSTARAAVPSRLARSPSRRRRRPRSCGSRPLRLVGPALADRHLRLELGEHRGGRSPAIVRFGCATPVSVAGPIGSPRRPTSRKVVISCSPTATFSLLLSFLLLFLLSSPPSSPPLPPLPLCPFPPPFVSSLLLFSFFLLRPRGSQTYASRISS